MIKKKSIEVDYCSCDTCGSIATWAWPSIRQEILDEPCTCMKKYPKPECGEKLNLKKFIYFFNFNEIF